MRTFRQDLERAVRFHGHLCSGQAIGVRMARLGLRLLGLDNETDGRCLCKACAGGAYYRRK